MKKFLILLILFIITPVYAAQIVNVEYIHNAIANRWDITIPYNPALTNPRVAANMKYLLSTIDVANEMLNGEPTTYGTGEYATTVAADTIATDTAVETLVKKAEKYVFTMRYSSLKDGLILCATGTFYLDWGDGIEQVIKKPNVGCETIYHPNGYTGAMTIRIGGRAIAYGTEPVVAALCVGVDQVTMIDGCLGCIFPTLPNGDQPNFSNLFRMCDFETIPSGLFNGVYGLSTKEMFKFTFAMNPYLKSIPENLFAGILGPLAESVFAGTFAYCTGLTGPSARINGQYLYEIWPDVAYYATYSGSEGLSDYNCIPTAWGGGGKNCLDTDPA